MRKLITSGALLAGLFLFSGPAMVRGSGHSHSSGGSGHSSSHSSGHSSSHSSGHASGHSHSGSSHGGSPRSGHASSGHTTGHTTGSHKPAGTGGRGPSTVSSSGKSAAGKGSYPKGGKSISNHDSRVTSQLSRVGSKFQKGKEPYGKSFRGKDGRNHRYDRCPRGLEHCSRSGDYCGWSQYCWNSNYGCCNYYCPESSSWYYWCEPRCCYLPCNYIQQYPPVEVEEAPCEAPESVEAAPCASAPCPDVSSNVCAADYCPTSYGNDCSSYDNCGGRGKSCWNPRGSGRYSHGDGRYGRQTSGHQNSGSKHGSSHQGKSSGRR
jgi:hypothetical protein